MVAMLGWIMPEPLAMPPMAKDPASVWTRTANDLGHVSVVMIACAAASPACGSALRELTMAGKAALILSSGNG